MIVQKLLGAGGAGGASPPAGPPAIRDSNATSSDSGGFQTLSITAPDVVAGDIVVIAIGIDSIFGVTSLGDLTGWTAEAGLNSFFFYNTRFVVYSTTVIGNESWIGGNITCTVGAAYSASVISVKNAASKQTGTAATGFAAVFTVGELTVASPAMQVVFVDTRDNGTISSIGASSAPFLPALSLVVASSSSVTNCGQASVYERSVPAGSTSTIEIETTTSGSFGLQMAFLE
jgi:hypothetical protein